MAHDNIYNIYFIIQILDCLFYYVSRWSVLLCFLLSKFHNKPVNYVT